MLSRTNALRQIISMLGDTDCFVSSLGYISRDLHALTKGISERCFYCMGSMGCVTPLALGVSLSNPNVHVYAIEGDGSLLMNLGGLVTLHRYAKGNITLIIFDNELYESSGGQSSQPEGFRIEDISTAVGLCTFVAREALDIKDFIQSRKLGPDLVNVLVIKVVPSSPKGRVIEEPECISNRFSSWMKGKTLHL